MTMPEFAGDLDEFIAGTLDFDSEPPTSVLGSIADRYSWALAYRTAERQRILAVAEERKAEIDAWVDARTAGLDRGIDWLTKTLEYHVRSVAEQSNGRTKSLTFSSGVIVKLRKAASRIDVRDPDGFIAWAKENLPSVLRVKTEPDKTALKQLKVAPDGAVFAGAVETALISPDGEIVPGVAVVIPEVDQFNITVPGSNENKEETSD